MHVAQALTESSGALEELEAARAQAVVYTDCGVARCCVLEVEVDNCSDIVLQVCRVHSHLPQDCQSGHPTA